MKNITLALITSAVLVFSCGTKTKEENKDIAVDQPKKTKHLFLDVHNLEPGKVTYEAVAGAHQKDLATQGKYDVNFTKYWVDEQAGKVYCLAESPDSVSIYNAHKEAHGLVPSLVHLVSDGMAAPMTGKNSLFFDIHEIGPGKVNAKAVAEVHEKDLAVQGKYGVNLINYWVDEKMGVVMCLAEAKDAESLANTHKEAHGLMPKEIHKVKQGE
jgi:Protein of unknown function (DUF4242)